MQLRSFFLRPPEVVQVTMGWFVEGWVSVMIEIKKNKNKQACMFKMKQ